MTSPESRMQEMRDAFEYWCHGYGLNTFKREDGTYNFNQTTYAWYAFQAAWSARTMPVEAIEWAVRSLRYEADKMPHAPTRQSMLNNIAALTQLLEQGK